MANLPALADLVAGVRSGDRTVLARAITLVESTRADHRKLAMELLTEVGSDLDGRSVRLGISGVPGAGKSTFIDTFGRMLTGKGHKVAVLAIDPSSTRSGGSILGDKTRMGGLATDPNAFIRPSPSAGTLGGVARATREAMTLVEAAGYDVVLVETVGVGQSETTVVKMVDTFLLLTLARTGDQLQGIKKGVLEIADVVAINKADGAHETDAKAASRELAGAFRLIQSSRNGWQPPVLTCSGLNALGLEEIWAQIHAHREHLMRNGSLSSRRQEQQTEWIWSMVETTLIDALNASTEVQTVRERVQGEVEAGALTPAAAVEAILDAFRP